MKSNNNSKAEDPLRVAAITKYCWREKSVHTQCTPHKLRPLNIIIASSAEIAASWTFSCVWLAFVLILTIFHHPKAKSLFDKLSCKKKRRLLPRKHHFLFFARKLANKMFFALGDERSSASAQRQTTQTGKISGCCNFYGRCNYRYSKHYWSWDHHVYVTEEPAEFHALGGREGIPPSTSKRVFHILGPLIGPTLYK